MYVTEAFLLSIHNILVCEALLKHTNNIYFSKELKQNISTFRLKNCALSGAILPTVSTDLEISLRNFQLHAT